MRHYGPISRFLLTATQQKRVTSKSNRPIRVERPLATSDGGKPAAAQSVRLTLALGLIAVAVAVGLLALSSRQLGRRPNETKPAADAQPTESPAESLGPAYGPAATADQMLAEARRVAESVVAAHPQQPAALSVLARLELALGESQRAAELWQQSVTLGPSYADGYLGVGAAVLRRGEFARAVEMLERAAALAPGDPRVSTPLAAAWIGLGENDKAIAVLEKAAESGALSAEASIMLGQAYLDRQQYEQAKRVYEQLVQQSPPEPKAFYGLARACLRLGRREEASRYMQRFQESQQQRVTDELAASHAFSDAARSRGLLARTLYEAAAVHAQAGDAASAERLWQGVAHLDPKHAAVRRLLLSLYQDEGRSREALAVGRQLCELEPRTAEHWFQVALLHGGLGEFAPALAAVDQAVGLEPGNERYRQARDVIRKGAGQ